MPLRADVLRVCCDRDRDPWAISGQRARDLAADAVPSILPGRVRPGADHAKRQSQLFRGVDVLAEKTRRFTIRSSAAQAFTIEREVCLTAPISDCALGAWEWRATPQRQEKLFA